MKKILRSKGFRYCLLGFFAFWLTICLWQAPVVKRVQEANPPIRGVWLTNYGSSFSYYLTRLDELTANLAKHHINTLYPAVWNRGNTLYASDVMKAAGGAKRDPFTSLPLLPFQNTLGALVHQAHRQNIRIIPWFEYGLWVPASSAIARQHPDWLTTNQAGNIVVNPQSSGGLLAPLKPLRLELTGENQAWLNPVHPEVRQFLIDLIVEVVQKYDVDGIQLDDHFGLPVAFGYDDYTQAEYRKSHQGISPPQDPNDPEWVAWRAEKITSLMADISQAVRVQQPEAIISVSPSPPAFAYQKYLQDWIRWVDLGLVDESLVQVYRKEPEHIQAELAKQSFAHLRDQIPVGIGLYTGPSFKGKKNQEIETEVQVIRDAGYEDVSFFCWETTFWVLKKSDPAQVQATFQKLFGQV